MTYSILPRIFFTLLFIFSGVLFGCGVMAAAPELIEPTLQVDIPTVKFSDVEIDGDILRINYLGDYIAGLYKYLIGISTTIAIVFIMISGLQWTFSGGSITGSDGKSTATKAKERIKNSVIGLILLLSTYLILATVNPQLVILPSIELENIDYEPLLQDSGDNSGSVDWAEVEAKLADIGITCSGEGESSSDLGSLARSFSGKVTYRFGAKGGDPQYVGEQSRRVDGQYTANFCPEGTICSDCSGFVDIVRQCAGLESLGESGGTSGIFSGAESLTECQDDGIVSTETESIQLVEGDLVGYKPGDREDQPKYGHVWMYIGGGKVISAMGGNSGRLTGNSVTEQSLISICLKYPLSVVQR